MDEELVDILVEHVEKELTLQNIEISVSKLDEIRDILDNVVENCKER